MHRAHTDKGFDVISNGTNCRVRHSQVSFDQVVDLAYPSCGRGPLIECTCERALFQIYSLRNTCFWLYSPGL